MKKLLLSMSVVLFSFLGFTQVSFYVDPPSTNSGNYSNTYADPSGGDWACPDMTDPANAVTGTLILVDDGTADDSLGCNALVNGAAISGNIAVIYRGECNFSTKALMAQNEGAIAVVIINHTGEPVGMAGGTDGANVTIPVVMISESAGEALHDEIVAGTLSCFIGNKFGYFADDIGMGQKDVLRANQFSNLQLFSQDASEFSVETGAWVYNFGSNDQTGVTLTCNIDLNGSTLYNEVSTPANILSGDSLYIAFATAFSQATYTNGYYTMTYSISSDVSDEFPDDNALNADFAMSDDLFTYSRVDETTMMPIANAGYRSNTGNNVFSNCVHFTNPNASRMAVEGITFSASTANDTPVEGLEGKLVNIEAYEWNDAIMDLNDAGFTMSATEFITDGEFAYDGDYQDSLMFAMFEEPFLLEDDAHYLFCVTTYDVEIFFGYDTHTDYDENIDNVTSPTTNNGQPTTVVQSDNGWAGAGFGTDITSAIGVNLIPAIELGIEDNSTQENIQAYPNPAVDMITVPLTQKEGNATINIVDLTGKTVSSQIVNLTNGNKLNLNVTDLEAGMYVFNVIYENGTSSTFNVVINK